MTNETEYEPVPWPEVRKGDVLFHENGDRLTVGQVRTWSSGRTVDVSAGYTLVASDDASHGFSPYRRKHEVPTEPGAHLDKAGNPWIVREDGCWANGDGDHVCHDNPGGMAEIAEFAPFTRLVPMPTEGQVREAADSGLVDRSEFAATAVTNAVMALLTGKEADDA